MCDSAVHVRFQFNFISISSHFISFHSHTSLDCEPRRLHVRLRGVAQVSAHECSSLSVCVCCGACGDALPFRPWGRCVSKFLGRAQRLPHSNPEGRHAPTAGGSHIHLRTTHPPLPLFHQPSEGGTYQGSWAPPLSAVCVCPSPWQPQASGPAKSIKTQGIPARRKIDAANA